MVDDDVGDMQKLLCMLLALVRYKYIIAARTLGVAVTRCA